MLWLNFFEISHMNRLNCQLLGIMYHVSGSLIQAAQLVFISEVMEVHDHRWQRRYTPYTLTFGISYKVRNRYEIFKFWVMQVFNSQHASHRRRQIRIDFVVEWKHFCSSIRCAALVKNISTWLKCILQNVKWTRRNLAHITSWHKRFILFRPRWPEIMWKSNKI